MGFGSYDESEQEQAGDRENEVSGEDMTEEFKGNEAYAEGESTTEDFDVEELLTDGGKDTGSVEPDGYGETDKLYHSAYPEAEHPYRIEGVSKEQGDVLREAGFETLNDVRNASVEELAEVEGIGQARAKELSDTTPKTESNVSDLFENL